jgi:hypothetical protein
MIAPESTKLCLCLWIAILTLAVNPAHGFPIITNVVETGGDNEATDTVPAKWTGVTFVNGVANEPLPNTPADAPYTVGVFDNHAPAMVDRNHRWTNASATVLLPSYLVGNEYIMIGNDNRDNTGLRLDISVATPVYVYLLIDNRLGDTSGATPPTFGPTAMQWVLDEGWMAVTNGINRTGNLATPDEIAIDEGADGTLNQWSSIYVKIFPAGTFQLKQADNAGQNMYGVVVRGANPPSTPQDLLAVSGDNKVTLTWAPAAGASSYSVKRSDTSGGPYATITSVITPTYMDTTVVNGSTYYYVVSAVNGVGESADSNEAVGQPKAAPSNVVAVGGTGQVQVSWDAFPNAASYRVGRSTVSGGPYTTIVSGVGGTSHLDTTVQSGRTYYYVVVAHLIGGSESGQSGEGAGTTAPSAPAGLDASIWAATVQRLTWTIADPVVSDYVLEQSADGVNFALLATVSGTQRSYTNSGLTLGTFYYYRVRAQNLGGLSDFSNIASNSTPTGGFNVNFANAINGTPANNLAPTPVGYVQDIGELFGFRSSGLIYGWDRDITVDSRWRMSGISPDLRYDTFNHFQKLIPSAIWEIDIPNGFYWVHIASGDATAVDSVFQQNIEGVITSARTPATGNNFHEFTNTCLVSDGRLSVTTGPVGANNKINFIDIYPAVPLPVVITGQPQGQALEENRPLVLSVGITAGPVPANAQFYGLEPVSYQWYRNDSPVDGATGPTLNVPLAQTGDSGNYYVVVMNPAGPVTSDTVVVTVNQDEAPPEVVSVGSVDGKRIGICFNELVDPISGFADPFNYQIDDGMTHFAAAVELRPDGKSVVLILALDENMPPLPEQFSVTVLSGQDLAQNTFVAPGNTGTGNVLGFVSEDIGGPALAGSSLACNSTEIEIVGGGADVWGNADQFHLVSTAASGDFDARVRVISLAGSNAITKAVLVARENNAPGSRALHVSVNPLAPARDQIELGFRATTDGGSGAWGGTFVPGGIPNAWLRVTRLGNVFNGYRSTNGVDWILMGTSTQVFPASMTVGIGVTAHDNTLLATGLLSNFQISALIVPPTLGNLTFDGTSFSASFHAQSGISYVVEYKDDLNALAWTPMTTILGAGSVASFIDPGPVPITRQRIYRIRIE